MNILINTIDYNYYAKFPDGLIIEMDVNFTINGEIDSNITICNKRRLSIDEIIDYIRKELEING